MQAVPVTRLLALLAWLILIAGCSQTPERPSPSELARVESERAAALIGDGQYLAGADIYRRLAAQVTDPALRNDYLLAAIDATLRGGDLEGARELIGQTNSAAMTPNQTLLARLLQAELLLREQRATDALLALDKAPLPTASDELKIRYYRDLAATYRQMGNLLETANALESVDALLTDHQQRLETQTDILRTLALLNEMVLTNLQPSPPGIPGGWMELALLVKRHGSDPAALATNFAEWRERFPDHPALPELLDNYQQQLRSQLQSVSRIAVLLPQSGPYAPAAAAIRDGLMISRFDLPEQSRPELRFYDTTDAAGIWPLYSQAVADGAEMVIGPLQKEAVAQLMRAGDLPVPVLALNQVETDVASPQNLYLYSLSPEDEARQAAERAWLDGFRRPVVLAPQGNWGDRIDEAFEQRWNGLGGTVAGVGRYDETSHDYSETIKQLLHLDASEARYRELQSWLGQKLEFEEHRRDDVDAVFMAARPVQAQGLRPQLQFHHAGDLPIYATSDAWVGAISASQAEDMRGVKLPDMPWMLGIDTPGSESRTQVAEYLPHSNTGYARLYAMGMDAFLLVPHLKRLQSSRYESLDANSGNLFMDEQNQIHRQLVWVELDVEPKVLGYAPRMDLQGADINQLGASPGSEVQTEALP